MKFSLMQEVYIQSDVLNLGAPIGELAYVVNIDRKVDAGQTYSIRVPSKKSWYWMPECDLVSAGEYLSNAADEIIRSSLVDIALEKRDSEMFDMAVKRDVAQQ